MIKSWPTKRGMVLKSKVSGVLPSGYNPELEASELLDENDSQFWLLVSCVGLLSWDVLISVVRCP